jgi:hypothetical protein
MLDMQKLLVQVGAVKENDHRILRRKDPESKTSTGLRRGNLRMADEEDEWD